MAEDCDDDAFLAKVNFELLGLGELHIACDGARAIELLTEAFLRQTNDLQHPYGVLTDLRMPHVNGVELIRWIRSQAQPELAHIPIIIVADICDGAITREALRCGADFCIQKPVNWAEALEHIDSIAATHAPQA
jgi:CheY-like chemotaxis protein